MTVDVFEPFSKKVFKIMVSGLGDVSMRTGSMRATRGSQPLQEKQIIASNNLKPSVNSSNK